MLPLWKRRFGVDKAKSQGHGVVIRKRVPSVIEGAAPSFSGLTARLKDTRRIDATLSWPELAGISNRHWFPRSRKC